LPASRPSRKSSTDIHCSVGVIRMTPPKEPLQDRTWLLKKHCTKRSSPSANRARLLLQPQPARGADRNFPAHIAAARDGGLPLIVHTRDAPKTTRSRSFAEEQERGRFYRPHPLLHRLRRGLPARRLELGSYISVFGNRDLQKSDTLALRP
jgi:hypothetical protein